MKNYFLKWKCLDNLDPLPESSGVYVLCVLDTPFYVGTAKNLKLRITAHKRLFKTGKRTYFPLNFPPQNGEWFDKTTAFIPGSSSLTDEEKKESLKFFEEIKIYFCEIENRSLINVEANLQKYFRMEYNAEDQIPGTRSKWFGKTEAKFEDCVLKHEVQFKPPVWLTKLVSRDN